MNEKLQIFLTKLALKYSPFGKEWYSGPKCFEDGLNAKGIKLPEHLYYQYKLPGNDKPELYMMKLALYSFFIDYDKYGYDICSDKTEKITQSEKNLIINEIRSKQKEYAQKILDDGKELLKQNPNLQHLSVNPDNVFDILAGATFWYLPRNIEYFIDYKNRDINKEQEIYGIIKKYGIQESCGILAPEVADMIISALEKHKQTSFLSYVNKNQEHQSS
ncbi:MAG: hypothetical protein J6R22_03230 [Alphaproteobacteria bacterium]|nr:hypothetical protein [Alphaproteobacteria bacterium]